MTHVPMESYLRSRLKVELLKLDRMRAVATFPPDLQGPPEAGHGGGAAALLFEMVRIVAGERGGEMVLPRPVRIEVVLHREIPLDVRSCRVIGTPDSSNASYRQHLTQIFLVAALEVRDDGRVPLHHFVERCR